MATQQQQALDKVSQLVDALQEEQTLSQPQKQEITHHVEQIQEVILKGDRPEKEQFDQLIKAIGAHESIMEHVLPLGQSFGYLPSL